MPDTQDNDIGMHHTISQNIGWDDRHLPQIVARFTTAIGKIGKTIGHCQQPLGDALSGSRVENRNIGHDCFQIVDRFIGPDDPQVSRQFAAAAKVRTSPTISTNAQQRRG